MDISLHCGLDIATSVKDAKLLLICNPGITLVDEPARAALRGKTSDESVRRCGELPLLWISDCAGPNGKTPLILVSGAVCFRE